MLRKNRELEEFSSRVSHDLRNELLVLKRTLQGAPADPAQSRERSAAILERYDRLIAFVQRLLDLARAGVVISRREAIPAAPFVQELFERLRPGDVEAELHVPANAVPFHGDPLGLDQVFANLFSNSFQHRDPARGRVRIEVETRVAEGETEVVYRDDGEGINPENLDRVFDMSFTTDRSHRFGLGLSFAKKIVEAHGGRILAASAGKGKGAEFVIHLPLPKKERAKAAAGEA
jgi:signal transduction histidine kinase